MFKVPQRSEGAGLLAKDSSPEQLFQRIYLPLQLWLQQHGQDYPWSPASAWSPASPCPNTDPSSKAGQPIGLPSTLPDSYAVWVSEVMLQQTRVETVKPYYLQWLARWPSLSALAQAEEAQVLKQWEGLGYYNRALNMLKCARVCVDELGLSGLPHSFAELLALPGIGPYIAAAVASVSANQAVLALDTNVKRIFSRLYQQQAGQAVEKRWQECHDPVLALCPWRGSANISLIQLGQKLCKAKNPLCFRCPLQDLCPVAASGNWAEFPAQRRYQRHKRQSQRLLLRAEGKYLMLRKRSGHLQHLWRFPEFRQLNESLSGSIAESQTEYLGSFQHAYLQTQEQVQVFCYNSPDHCRDLGPAESRSDEGQPQRKEAVEWRWACPAELQQLTLAGPYRKFLQQLLDMAQTEQA